MLLFREHLHHLILQCAVLIAVPVALIEYYVVHSELLNRHGGNLGKALHVQLGPDGMDGLGISLYAQLGINGLFD